MDEGGFFPNSVILNIETDRRGGLRFDHAGKAEGAAKLGFLHLPQTYRAAYVIDGQHRLYGYARSDRAANDLIPVVAFVNLERSERVRLFMQINENQQAVPKNLRNTLNSDLLWDSDDPAERARALRLRIAQHLGEQRPRHCTTASLWARTPRRVRAASRSMRSTTGSRGAGSSEPSLSRERRRWEPSSPATTRIRTSG